MNKPLTILLATLVFVANMLCMCVGRASASSACGSESVDVQVRSHCDQAADEPSCHGHGGSDRKSSDDDGNPHACGHCTGSVSMDVSKAKSAASDPALALALSPLPLNDLFTVRAVCRYVPAHRAQPPPVSPPTLFDLACLLTI